MKGRLSGKSPRAKTTPRFRSFLIPRLFFSSEHLHRRSNSPLIVTFSPLEGFLILERHDGAIPAARESGALPSFSTTMDTSQRDSSLPIPQGPSQLTALFLERRIPWSSPGGKIFLKCPVCVLQQTTNSSSPTRRGGTMEGPGIHFSPYTPRSSMVSREARLNRFEKYSAGSKRAAFYIKTPKGPRSMLLATQLGTQGGTQVTMAHPEPDPPFD
jgi:hypothetical protein